MNRSLAQATASVATVILLGACSDGTSLEQLDETLFLDVALVAADATIEDVNLWSQPLGVGPQASPSAESTNLEPGRPGGMGGFGGTVTGTRSRTFYDEAGDVQQEFDALTTASIHFVHEIEGEVGREGWSATVHRERDKTVSGLEGEETTRTWNGTGTEEVSRSRHLDDGTERSYESEGSVEYEDVVVPVPGSESRWPLSGTITRSMTVVRSGPDGERTHTAEVVITFNGTSMVTAVVNGEAIDIDLSARTGRSPLRRRDG